MATVQIADIFNPLTFGQFIDEDQIELNRFIMSGALMMDPSITDMVGAGGNIGELTGFKPLGTDEPNYSTDVPGSSSTPLNTTKYVMTFRSAAQNQSWSTMDLSRELALKDPVDAITSKVGQYWATQNERRMIQSSLGILANNVAADGGDMLNDISSDVGTPILAAETISAEAVIDTQQTSGDHNLYTGIGLHSVVFASLKKQNLIDFIPNARGEVVIPTYLGMTVIVDDSMPAVMGVNRIKYTTVLFGPGAFVGAQGQVQNPMALDRNEEAGNGGGEEIMFSRRSDIVHPIGFDFLSGSVAGQSATQAELALAANWDRVWERKNINLAFLETNA